MIHDASDVPSHTDPDAIVIDLEPGVSMYSSSTKTARNGRTEQSSVMKIDGKEFALAEGELHLGGKRYGPLSPGSLVRIGKGSVQVDGKDAEPIR